MSKRNKPKPFKMQEHLLVDEAYIDSSLACNLTQLARDIFPEEAMLKPQIIGAKLNRVVDTLPDPERMVIIKLYGLISPRYERSTLKSVAKEHKVSEYKLNRIKKNALLELARLKRQAVYHVNEINLVKDKQAHPERYISLARLSTNFKCTSIYYALKRIGVETIYQFANFNLDELNDAIEKTGIDFRYCDLKHLHTKAVHFKPTEKDIATVIVRGTDGLWWQNVEDLVGKITVECANNLKNEFIESISDFLTANESELNIAVGNFLDIEEVFALRAELDFPIEPK